MGEPLSKKAEFLREMSLAAGALLSTNLFRKGAEFWKDVETSDEGNRKFLPEAENALSGTIGANYSPHSYFSVFGQRADVVFSVDHGDYYGIARIGYSADDCVLTRPHLDFLQLSARVPNVLDNTSQRARAIWPQFKDTGVIWLSSRSKKRTIRTAPNGVPKWDDLEYQEHFMEGPDWSVRPGSWTDPRELCFRDFVYVPRDSGQRSTIRVPTSKINRAIISQILRDRPFQHTFPNAPAKYTSWTEMLTAHLTDPSGADSSDSLEAAKQALVIRLQDGMGDIKQSVVRALTDCLAPLVTAAAGNLGFKCAQGTEVFMMGNNAGHKLATRSQYSLTKYGILRLERPGSLDLCVDVKKQTGRRGTGQEVHPPMLNDFRDLAREVETLAVHLP